MQSPPMIKNGIRVYLINTVQFNNWVLPIVFFPKRTTTRLMRPKITGINNGHALRSEVSELLPFSTAVKKMEMTFLRTLFVHSFEFVNK